MARRVRITITMLPDILHRVDRIAKAQGFSRSEYLERMTRDALARDEVTVKAMTNPTIMAAFARAIGQEQVLKSLAGVLGDELADDQLKLFTDAVEQLSEMGERAARESGTPGPGVVSRSRKKTPTRRGRAPG